MNSTVTMTMTREEAVRVLAMLAQDPTAYVKPAEPVVEPVTLVAPPAPVVEEPQDWESDTPTADEMTPSTTPLPPATTDSLFDINGTPWDERIHSGGKSKLANGQWTKRRGVTPALYDMVMSELTVAAATPLVPPPAPPAPVTPPAPPAPPAPVEDSPFVALQKKVQAWIAAAVDGPQRSERAQALGKALKDYGVVSIPALASQPDLIPAIEMALAL